MNTEELESSNPAHPTAPVAGAPVNPAANRADIPIPMPDAVPVSAADMASEIPTLEVGGLSRIHFIGGEKGGVGKSVLSRLLSQYFIDHGVPFAAFDSDR